MPTPLAKRLRAAGFRGELLAEHPLAPLTTWRIGGPAELLATPVDVADAGLALRWAASSGVDARVLGNGSNLLVRDEGVRGLVVRVRGALAGVSVSGPRIEAGGGVSFPKLANVAAEHGLAGLEFAAGIPGTLGGAVVMNAGWHEHETGNAVASVTYVQPDGEIVVLDHAACRFAYRQSALRGRPGIVASATLELRHDDPAAVKVRLARFAESRKANQPTDLPSCGSVFLKPDGDFAGRLIEAAGLKGRSCGAIQVSPKHANFFVNLGGGTARDVLELVTLVEREVARACGVSLTREFEIW